AIAGLGAAAGGFGLSVGRYYEYNLLCCSVPRFPNLKLSVRETLRLDSFPSQIGQDKWVSETVFPGVTDGFFVDVGSGDGYQWSNTVALERKGWTGICIDPFPTHMEGRTCQMFKEVVFNQAGQRVLFHQANALAGIEDTLGAWKTEAEKVPGVELTTVTLGD